MASMAKLQVTFEVDTIKLFDTLTKLNGDVGPLGQRIAGILMTGKASALELAGLAVYGIDFTDGSEL